MWWKVLATSAEAEALGERRDKTQYIPE